MTEIKKTTVAVVYNDAGEDFYEKIRVCLNPKDYIRFCLTGEYATEVSDASGTGLFDVRQRRWCYPLADLLDISVDGFLKFGMYTSKWLIQDDEIGIEHQ